MTLAYSVGNYHYTLYYYDRAGNLMKTIPPKGVAFLTVNSAAALATAKTQFPAHTYATTYEYNSLGQLVKQTTPDAGTTLFCITTTASCASPKMRSRPLTQTYSYTKYDAPGPGYRGRRGNRVVAATLVANRNIMTFPATGAQVTKTFYTDPRLFALPAGFYATLLAQPGKLCLP